MDRMNTYGYTEFDSTLTILHKHINKEEWNRLVGKLNFYIAHDTYFTVEDFHNPRPSRMRKFLEVIITHVEESTSKHFDRNRFLSIDRLLRYTNRMIKFTDYPKLQLRFCDFEWPGQNYKHIAKILIESYVYDREDGECCNNVTSVEYEVD